MGRQKPFERNKGAIQLLTASPRSSNSKGIHSGWFTSSFITGPAVSPVVLVGWVLWKKLGTSVRITYQGRLPSGNPTWHAGKWTSDQRFSYKILHWKGIFHCHVGLPEGAHQFVQTLQTHRVDWFKTEVKWDIYHLVAITYLNIMTDFVCLLVISKGTTCFDNIITWK